MTLKGATALVTGASRGLGRVIAQRLLSEGMNVGLIARDPGGLDAVMADLGPASREGARMHAVVGDATDESSIRRAVEEVERSLGSIELAVANVGAFLMRPLAKTTLEDWRRLIDVNLTSAFLLARSVLPLMMVRGRGCLLTIGSGASKKGIGLASAYSAAKSGLLGLTESLAEEVKGRGVRVAAILPAGVIDTEVSRKEMAGEPSTWIDPRDVAEAVVYLAKQGPRAMTTQLTIAPPNPIYG